MTLLGDRGQAFVEERLHIEDRDDDADDRHGHHCGKRLPRAPSDINACVAAGIETILVLPFLFDGPNASPRASLLVDDGNSDDGKNDSWSRPRRENDDVVSSNASDCLLDVRLAPGAFKEEQTNL